MFVNFQEQWQIHLGLLVIFLEVPACCNPDANIPFSGQSLFPWESPCSVPMELVRWGAPGQGLPAPLEAFNGTENGSYKRDCRVTRKQLKSARPGASIFPGARNKR